MLEEVMDSGIDDGSQRCEDGGGSERQSRRSWMGGLKRPAQVEPTVNEVSPSLNPPTAALWVGCLMKLSPTDPTTTPPHTGKARPLSLRSHGRITWREKSCQTKHDTWKKKEPERNESEVEGEREKVMVGR